MMENTQNFLANFSSRLLQSRGIGQTYHNAGRGDMSDGGNSWQNNNLLNSYRGNSSTHQNFGISTNTSTTSTQPPNTFDLSEFPTLGGNSTPASNHNNSNNNQNNNNNNNNNQNSNNQNSSSNSNSNFLAGGHSAPGSSRPAYVGILKEGSTRQSGEQTVAAQVPAMANQSNTGFSIHSEDFPALPGSNSSGLQIIGGRDRGDKTGTTGDRCTSGGGGSMGAIGGKQTHDSQPSGSGLSGLFNSSNSTTMVTNNVMDGKSVEMSTMSEITANKSMQQQQQARKAITTSKDGRVCNIPAGMVTDQFGMVGLLAFLRAAESDPNIVSLALGTDLTALKLDLNSSDSLYSTFSGPWSDQPLKPHEIDYPVPQEYLINNQIRDKLATIKLNRYGDDTLFYLFYLFPNDFVQVAAANELYTRDWRYHKDEKVWITRAPGMPPSEKTPTFERGTYYFFDAHNWRRVAKEFHLDYDRLENRPVPANQAIQQTVGLGNLVGI